MRHLRIPVREYEKLAAEFNPVEFDADGIARLARYSLHRWYRADQGTGHPLAASERTPRQHGQGRRIHPAPGAVGGCGMMQIRGSQGRTYAGLFRAQLAGHGVR